MPHRSAGRGREVFRFFGLSCVRQARPFAVCAIGHPATPSHHRVAQRPEWAVLTQPVKVRASCSSAVKCRTGNRFRPGGGRTIKLGRQPCCNSHAVSGPPDTPLMNVHVFFTRQTSNSKRLFIENESRSRSELDGWDCGFECRTGDLRELQMTSGSGVGRSSSAGAAAENSTDGGGLAHASYVGTPDRRGPIVPLSPGVRTTPARRSKRSTARNGPDRRAATTELTVGSKSDVAVRPI
jgi:hypothetical protein